MFYLQRSGSADQEGPFSFEFLRQMVKDGQIFGDDKLIAAEGGAPFPISDIFEWREIIQSRPESVSPNSTGAYRPPNSGDYSETATAKPSNSKISGGSIAVIATIVLLTLCCIPGLIVSRGLSGAAERVGYSGVGSVDAMAALRSVSRASLNYANDWDGFYPDKFDEGIAWQNQLRPYLEPGFSFEVEPGKVIEANPNLAEIRSGSIIDPSQTLLHFVREPILGDQSAVSNCNGDAGYVDSQKLADSIRRDIYNVPIDQRYRRRR